MIFGKGGFRVSIKKKLFWLIGVLCLASGWLPVTAHATDTAATANMPQGVSSLDNIFTTPTLSGSLSNSAKFIYSTNSSNTGQPAIQITDAAKQVGAVWSTAANELDLSKNQTASMWLYFGNQGDNAGDGMAFVLQNVGTSAITSGLTSKVAPGQTLGVWGLDTDNSISDSTKIAAKAIQDSWALEFDEYDNGSTKGADNGGFDSGNGVDGAHIASNYPGDAATYVRHGTSSNSSKYYYTMKHQGIQSVTLSDGNWHHMTLNWQAPAVGETTGTMTYTFNDKNPSTGLAQTGTTTSTSVDIAKLGLTAVSATSSARNVYWGFTGSTGGNYANNVVAFEHVPGLVDANGNLTITDDTLDKTITKSSDYVNGGDDITYQYKLNYTGGTQDWTGITTSLPHPNGISFKSGQVTYADGSTEDFTASELAASTISHKLKTALSSTNSSATVTLKGTADGVAADTTIASASNGFNGTNQVVTVESPSYLVHPQRDLYLRMLSTNGTTVKPGEKLTLSGTVSADSSATNDPLTNKDVTMHVSLANGNTIDDFTMNGKVDDATEDGYFNFDLPASKLSAGTNAVTVYATDDRGNKSNKATFNIVLVGSLKFGTVAKDSSFNDTVLEGKTQTVLRKNDWQVEVDNTLGKGSTWNLQVAAEQFKNSVGESLDGSVIYVDSDGTQHTLGSTPTTIMTQTATSDSETTDITKDWTINDGVMLKINGAATGGTYSGDLTWTLTNSVS